MSTSTFDIPGPATPSAAIRPETWLQTAATAAVLSLAYGPLMWQFGVNQWARPHYQYFPFVLGAFAWLLWRNTSSAVPRENAPGKFARLKIVGLMITAWLLLALSYFVDSPWLAVVSAILLVASLLLQLSLKWHVEYLWGIWAMLWLIVPLPLSRDQQLIVWLQHVSSRLSSIFLDWVGVAHLMDGNTLLLPMKQFFVDEACSGIVSVMSVVACAVIYGIWRNRPAGHVVLLAAAGIGWATFMNVVRITAIAVAFDRASVDWSTGAAHETLGLIIFAIIFLALVSTDVFLVGLLAPIGPTWEQISSAPVRFGQAGVRLWDRVFAQRERSGSPEDGLPARPADGRRVSGMTLHVMPLAAFALLAALQFTRFGLAERAVAGPATDAEPAVQRALACSAGSLPPQVGLLQRAKFVPQTRDRDDILGNFSRTYEYRDANGTHYVASCDFPYSGGWHELTVCYRGLGWELQERRIGVQESDPHAESWPCLEADFSKPDGMKGFLVASAFDYTGQPVELPSYSFFDDLSRALTNSRGARGNRSVFQVQVWTTAARPIDGRDREAARQLLTVARQRFHELITASAGPGRDAPAPSEQ